jgi:hypothetical protein
MDRLLQAGKILARPRSCYGGLIADPNTHRRRERPQLALREYSKDDGVGHFQDAHPSKAPFYGIVPGDKATPLGLVVLPVTFGMKDNFRMEYIKIEVADFQSSYHAILGRPALAKFMAVFHYVYLLLKMLRKTGILTFHGDLKKSYDCNQEAIEYAVTSRVLEPSVEVFAAAQKLTNSEMEISS